MRGFLGSRETKTASPPAGSTIVKKGTEEISALPRIAETACVPMFSRVNGTRTSSSLSPIPTTAAAGGTEKTTFGAPATAVTATGVEVAPDAPHPATARTRCQYVPVPRARNEAFVARVAWRSRIAAKEEVADRSTT